MELDQINAQLAAIATQLTNLSQKQVEQDQVLTYLGQKLETPVKPVVPQEPTHDNQKVADIFRIPDPIKSIPSFDGNKKQVNAWLKTAEETLSLFAELVPQAQFKMYTQAVKNKIEGKAKDILCLAGDPETFTEIKAILLEALGDKQELSYYKSQLWANKQQDTMNIHSFYKKTKEIVQNIKSLAKQNATYYASWNAISTFIEEDALAAFISGLKKPYFGYAQAAKPKSIEEAYAFLCKFTSNETISVTYKKNQSQTVHSRVTQLDTNHSKYNLVQNKPKDIPNFQTKRLDRPPTEYMEVDPSSRTRNSGNKKFTYNTHEVLPDDNKSVEISNTETSHDDENSDLGNFQEELDSDTES